MSSLMPSTLPSDLVSRTSLSTKDQCAVSLCVYACSREDLSWTSLTQLVVVCCVAVRLDEGRRMSCSAQGRTGSTHATPVVYVFTLNVNGFGSGSSSELRSWSLSTSWAA